MVMVEEQVRDQALEPVITTAPPAFLGWAKAVGLAWAVGLPAGLALEPAPTQPDAVPSVLGTVLSFALISLLAATASGLVQRARWGFAASAGGAFLLAGMAIACPVSGHHAMGLWWVGQAAIAVGLMALSVFGWQRAGSTSASR